MTVVVTLDSNQAGRDTMFGRYIRRGTLTVGTYATNGVATTKADYDLWHSLVDLRIDSSGGYVFEYDKTNAKIKAYRQKDPADTGGADVPLPEVANGVSLSAITPRFRAEGK